MQIYKEFELKDILWYKIGGTTKYFIEVSCEEELKEAFDYISQNNISKFFVVGLGANLLFTDEYFDGAVIRISSDPQPIIINTQDDFKENSHSDDQDSKHDIVIKDDLITAFAGVTLDAVIQVAFNNNMIGLEWAGGLPSTIGAAIRGNVGAFGGEISASTVEAKVLRVIDRSYNETTLSNESLSFAYRSSVVKKDKNLVVVTATFKMKRASDIELENAKSIYSSNKLFRQAHHPDPSIYPNTGSTFKNITAKDEVDRIMAVWPDIKELVATKWYGKVAVGYINNRLGFAGYKIGNAQVSPMHANFILNLGMAKSADVEAIIRTIQKKYNETFGFIPEPEVEIIT